MQNIYLIPYEISPNLLQNFVKIFGSYFRSFNTNKIKSLLKIMKK